MLPWMSNQEKKMQAKWFYWNLMEHSSEGCHNIVSPQYSRKHSLLPGTCKSLYVYILNCIPEYTESCHSWHHNLNIHKKISNKLRRRALTSVYALEITCYGTIT